MPTSPVSSNACSGADEPWLLSCPSCSAKRKRPPASPRSACKSSWRTNATAATPASRTTCPRCSANWWPWYPSTGRSTPHTGRCIWSARTTWKCWRSRSNCRTRCAESARAGACRENAMSDRDRAAPPADSARAEGRVFDGTSGRVSGRPARGSGNAQTRQRMARAIVHRCGMAAEEMQPGLSVTVSGKTTRRRLAPPADPPIPLPSPGLADGRLRILALATVASLASLFIPIHPPSLPSTPMTDHTTVCGLQVATPLLRFIEDRVLPGTGVDSAAFWQGFAAIVADLAPRNLALLAERERLQTALDAWHQANPGPIGDMAAYRSFLEKIGYLLPPIAQVQASTTGVDDELATQAGPQVVVPILNARYALNAAKGGGGSLYDALYGTDVIPDTGATAKGRGYNPVRGAQVIAFARQVLDEHVPLASGAHRDATGYRVADGQLLVALPGGASTGLAHPGQFKGYQGNAASPSSVLLQHNGLHLDIRIDRSTPIGQ